MATRSNHTHHVTAQLKKIIDIFLKLEISDTLDKITGTYHQFQWHRSGLHNFVVVAQARYGLNDLRYDRIGEGD